MQFPALPEIAMQRIQAVPLPNSFGTRGPRRWAAIGIVGLMHAALFYALLSGLAVRFVEQLPSAIQVDVVKPPPPAQRQAPPPPAPELAAPAVPEIPVPQIRIAHPQPVPHAITAVAVPNPVIAPRKSSPLEQAPLAPAPVIASQPARGIESTHTTPPYPPVALRLNIEGVVGLHIALDARGVIQKVDIAKSSGSDILDRAAAEWVLRHWRYAAATRDGKPVASSVLANVRFDLVAAR